MRKLFAKIRAMSWFNKIEDGSRTILLMAQSSASMRRRFALGAAVLLVVIVVGGYFLFRHMTAQSAEQVANAWASLNQCVIGAPLEKDEKPSLRFRAIQLTAMSMPSQAGKEKEQWPARCAVHAHALRDGLTSLSEAPEGEKNLAFWSGKLASALTETGAVAADLTEVIDSTWAQAAKEGMQLDKGQATGPKPPEPTEAMTIAELANATPIVKAAPALDSAHTDVHPGTALHLLVADSKKEETVACTLAPDAKAMKCEPIPAVIPATELGIRLLGTCEPGADPLVFSGSRGSEGIYRARSGEKIAATTSLGGYAAGSYSAVLGWDEAAKRISLTRKSGSDDPRDFPVRLGAKLEIANPLRDVRLLWDHVLFRGTNRYDETWLASAKIEDGPVAHEVPADVGMLPESGANRPPNDTDVPIAGCRTDKSRIVRVRGDSHDFLSFFVADKWTKPVQASRTGGDLSCRRVEAWLTRFEAPPGAGMLESSIMAERCSPTKCQADRVSMEEVFKGTLALAPVVAPMVGQLGGKILIVWMAGERGGLRMRLAALDELDETPDQVLFDDLVQDGQVVKTSTIAETKLFVRESFALLLVRTSEGLHGMRIDTDGKVETVKVEN